MCVVYLRTPENNKWQEICRTEVIDNSLNPDFTTKVSIISNHYLFSFNTRKYKYNSSNMKIRNISYVNSQRNKL